LNFHWPSRPVSIQPLTEMYTRDISWRGWCKGGPVLKADDLTIFMCRLSRNLGSLRLLEPSRLVGLS
jgi:hypothetical protein